MQFAVLLGGLALLYAGAEAFVRGAASLALRLGLTPLVIGLTVMAFGTSLPELVVSVGAALGGSGAIAAGNVVGSNIANVALILGASALVRPCEVKAQILRLDMPIVVAVSVVLAWLIRDGALTRPEGALLFAGIVAYTTFSIRAARAETRREVAAEFAEALPARPGGTLLDFALIGGGLAALVLGARLVVGSAIALAAGYGVSQTVIGLTIVAVGTSLPELATSMVAAARKAGDIAIGNVVGSNIFNILGILGAASLVRPLADTGVGRVDLGVMIAMAVVLLPLMRSGFRLTRTEGAFLLACYAVYIVYRLP